ncbi:ABC transporter substrate-binding protein [Herbaspirillum rubrisubalbicans]|uniref:ABC transporter substrate-binding protein n=1 Tax=Herbaspirillum rubrisubalbicans TaxID=80842 RepID=A0AAD0XG19_9BURK|nr:ABC transporter substrate-binding protein [Herbaspirillum rubrisubalbicans]ALU88153.1 dipeptide ABC transporter periplasmic peptide-binding protein [Herbaspirillum rubrisubalbicans M1]AYR23224.1 ABC transporter substrate-binding protein [Herbaspirillum rubrisubalbicans]
MSKQENGLPPKEGCIITGDTLEHAHGGFTRRDMMRTLLAGSLMTVGGTGLLTASGNAMAQTGKRGGKLRMATQTSSTSDTLDPAKTGHATDYARVNMFYNGLTKLDGKLAPQMVLAEEMITTDAITWIVKLKKGVVFHDGKPLTPADVVYSIMRHKDPATASKVKVVADQFESVKATGPNEVQIKLTSANADLPVILSTAQFLIVRDGTTNFSTANGTGAFKLKEFTPGVRTIAVRNENYWKPGLPYLDEVELFGIPDEAARVNALLSGDVHWINDVNSRSTGRVKSTPGYTVMETKSGQYTDLVMRQDVAPGNNMDFTLGMKYLLDREQIKMAAFRGFAVIANDQPIDPTNRFYFAGLPQRPYDPDKAKFHLQKAGVLGSTIPIVASVAATGSVDMAVLMQQSAAKIGLKLDVKRVPPDGYWSNQWMKVPVGFGNINPRPSADILLTQFFKSDAQWNESGWKNPQFDQLVVAARGETDFNKRKAMYADLQTMIHEKCGLGIPVFIINLEGISTKVKGIDPVPLGAFMNYTCAEYVWLDA